MKTVKLIQGSKKWHEHRCKYENASEAPAMMGKSHYTSRNELLHEKKTGVAKEVNPSLQKIFDKGHHFEDLARNLVEEKYDIELYPVTGIKSSRSASYDGITMDEETCWEHKTLNDELRAVKEAKDLALHYRIQMEQQLEVSGAKKCIFSATKWDDNDELVEQIHIIYYPDLKLRKEIIAGWKQFQKDLEAYVPDVVEEKPKADAIKSLPMLSIQVEGKVVSSNLSKFEEEASIFLSNINEDLKDDNDFANAKEITKYLGQVEKDIATALDSAISQMETVDEMKRTVVYVKSQCREKRLNLEKLVKTKEQEIKTEIIEDALSIVRTFINRIETEIKPIKIMSDIPNFYEAIKGKRTLKSIHDVVDTEIANFKIKTNELADELRQKLAWMRENTGDFKFLFMDIQRIIYKPLEDLKLLVESRISNHKESQRDVKPLRSVVDVVMDEPQSPASVILKAQKQQENKKTFSPNGMSQERVMKVADALTILAEALTEEHLDISEGDILDSLRGEIIGEEDTFLIKKHLRQEW